MTHEQFLWCALKSWHSWNTEGGVRLLAKCVRAGIYLSCYVLMTISIIIPCYYHNCVKKQENEGYIPCSQGRGVGEGTGTMSLLWTSLFTFVKEMKK